MDAKDLVEILNGPSATAREMGVARQTIYDWIKKGMPGAWQEKAEIVTKGKFKPSKRAIDEVMTR